MVSGEHRQTVVGQANMRCPQTPFLPRVLKSSCLQPIHQILCLGCAYFECRAMRRTIPKMVAPSVCGDVQHLVVEWRELQVPRKKLG